MNSFLLYVYRTTKSETANWRCTWLGIMAVSCSMSTNPTHIPLGMAAELEEWRPCVPGKASIVTHFAKLNLDELTKIGPIIFRNNDAPKKGSEVAANPAEDSSSLLQGTFSHPYLTTILLILIWNMFCFTIVTYALLVCASYAAIVHAD